MALLVARNPVELRNPDLVDQILRGLNRAALAARFSCQCISHCRTDRTPAETRPRQEQRISKWNRL
jgi:hypothetical protein